MQHQYDEHAHAQLTAQQQHQLAYEQQLAAQQHHYADHEELLRQQQLQQMQMQMHPHHQQMQMHPHHQMQMQHVSQLVMPAQQVIAPRGKHIMKQTAQDEEAINHNRMKFLTSQFHSTEDLKAHCKEVGLSILRSDCDRVRLKLRGNTRMLLATFRLQKRPGGQVWKLSRSMTVEQVLYNWKRGLLSPEEKRNQPEPAKVQAPQYIGKRKRENEDLNITIEEVAMLHNVYPELFQKIKGVVDEAVAQIPQRVIGHQPMSIVGEAADTNPAKRAHLEINHNQQLLQQQQQQQLDQQLAAQHAATVKAKLEPLWPRRTP